jgi:translation initiation factor 2B subunit (eIF-2B alpha/beta/delta family)
MSLADGVVEMPDSRWQSQAPDEDGLLREMESVQEWVEKAEVEEVSYRQIQKRVQKENVNSFQDRAAAAADLKQELKGSFQGGTGLADDLESG